jgi:hypothetical protein
MLLGINYIASPSYGRAKFFNIKKEYLAHDLFIFCVVIQFGTVDQTKNLQHQ